MFARRNVLWNNIKTDKYYGIDLEQNKGMNLTADTKKLFDSLDLSQFNVIDCDSYGIPYDIYQKILTRDDVKKGTIVLYTAIAYEFTGLQNEIKELFGFDKFYSKATTLFNKKAIDFFYELLSLHGVDEVNFYSIHDPIDKHYGYFMLNNMKF